MKKLKMGRKKGNRRMSMGSVIAGGLLSLAALEREGGRKKVTEERGEGGRKGKKKRKECMASVVALMGLYKKGRRSGG